MGNRFREKTVEEGLDGDVAREALKDAARRSKGTGKTAGNRRRIHEEPAIVNHNSHEQSTTEKAEANEKWDVEYEEKVKRTEEQPIPDEVEDKDDTPKINGRGGRMAKGVAKVLGGDILADKLVLRQIPLLLLCLVFLLLLVANRYQIESLSRKKITVEERVNELREQQIQLQKENQNNVRISQIRDELEKERGLGILPTPPKVI